MKKIYLIIYTVLIVAVTAGIVFYFFTPKTMEFTSEEELSQEDVDNVINGLRDNILLPIEEEPFVAIINDIDSLVSEQPFYANASNGDYLVIYPQAARAIVYSLNNDQIINVGPVEFDTNAEQQQAVDVPVETFEDEVVDDESVSEEVE